MTNLKVYAMLPDELTNFVHNIAQAGDVATSYNAMTKRRYIYFCTKDNIGKDVNPVWMMVDEREMYKNYFKNMSLEEKVDFLIDKYIQDNT